MHSSFTMNIENEKSLNNIFIIFTAENFIAVNDGIHFEIKFIISFNVKFRRKILMILIVIGHRMRTENHDLM